jgi:hypothetical protein
VLTTRFPYIQPAATHDSDMSILCDAYVGKMRPLSLFISLTCDYLCWSCAEPRYFDISAAYFASMSVMKSLIGPAAF